MSRLAQLFRFFYIAFVLAKHGLDEILLATRLLAPIRFIVYLNPWTWIRDREKPRGVRIRHALEELGPIFVKFGQTLSTRPDLLPNDITDELELLQDDVPPFSGARKVIEKAYGAPVANYFVGFADKPLASASIAQVHTAELMDGTEVIVKVLRPRVARVIRRDIGLLYSFAKLIERYTIFGKRIRATELVYEFEQTLLNELDLTREAANASQLRRNFAGSDSLYVPDVYWPYSRDNVMVMERIHGIPIYDVERLKEKKVDLKKLAQRGVEIFFTQVFRDSFFHGDMHPGNLFVDAADPSSPQIIAVDFGIIGTLNPTDQRYLAENMHAFFKRDYRRVAQLHLDSGWVPPETRVEEFEAAIRTVCEPIFERPLREISFGQLLVKLFQTGKRFHMEIQPQLLLLQKTLIHIEGLGRRLYPDLDLWASAKPLVESWLKKQVGPRAIVKRLYQNLPYLIEHVPDVPRDLHKVLEFVRNEELRRSQQFSRENAEKKESPKFRFGSFLGGMGSALFAMGVALGVVESDLWSTTQELVRIAWILGSAGLGLLLITAWAK